MKRRRLVITSFLLAAVLVMGIGFAATADTLSVAGEVHLRPSSFVATEIADAIYFYEKSDTTNYMEPVITTSEGANQDTIFPVLGADVTGDGNASVTFTINGVAGRETPYTVTTVYKAVYEAPPETPNLPDVRLSVRPVTSGTEYIQDTFTATAKLYSDQACNNEITSSPIAPGTVFYVSVTITYTPNVAVGSTLTSVQAGNVITYLDFEIVTTNA
ncbi:MAG: hypothetical protein IKB34_00705 [Clostridia bacterium]|nr:hypothetical protein [Clostridia bacterium]